MRAAVVKRYLPDGTARAVWDDSQAARERRQGVMPRRASNVEAIEDGPNAGRFHVDFTRLADITGSPSHRACLPETFEHHAEAVAREVDWLRRNFVMGRCDAQGDAQGDARGDARGDERAGEAAAR